MSAPRDEDDDDDSDDDDDDDDEDEDEDEDEGSATDDAARNEGIARAAMARSNACEPPEFECCWCCCC